MSIKGIAQATRRRLNLRRRAAGIARRTLGLLSRTPFGGRFNTCPVCNSTSRSFEPYGLVPRPNARCPVCKSLERHRLDWMFLTERLEINNPAGPLRFLHMAPELGLGRKLSALPHIRYVSGDLEATRGPSLLMDVTRAPFRDESFDALYCSHVLEHVIDDRSAMRELRRVLRLDGWALIQVPVRGLETFEDASISSPEQRQLLFGQRDHVRSYGMDYVDRLEESGFSVVVEYYARGMSDEDRRRYGLLDHPLFLCRRKPGWEVVA